jgi:translation initiation factor 5A
MKALNAHDLKQGTFVMMDNAPSVVKSVDISKTGKHGASKCRIEAEGIFDGKKRIIAVPGSERFEIPVIDKRRAQVLSINKQEKKASVMDVETFETFDVMIDEGLEVEENMNVEYWQVEDKKMIKRIV